MRRILIFAALITLSLSARASGDHDGNVFAFVDASSSVKTLDGSLGIGIGYRFANGLGVELSRQRPGQRQLHVSTQLVNGADSQPTLGGMDVLVDDGYSTSVVAGYTRQLGQGRWALTAKLGWHHWSYRFAGRVPFYLPGGEIPPLDSGIAFDLSDSGNDLTYGIELARQLGPNWLVAATLQHYDLSHDGVSRAAIRLAYRF